MKNILFPLLSAGALAWSLAGCATASTAPEARPLPGHMLEARSPLGINLPSDDADSAGPALVERTIAIPIRGLDESEVLQALGSPGQRLLPGVWIYWQYYSREQAAENGGHDTLVVGFSGGRVRGMKLFNGELLRRYLAGRRQRAPLNEP